MNAARPVVLFACIHNSGRSVAAQVLARHYGGDAIDVRSAGSEPGDTVNPAVATVLAERGTPVTDHTPTLLDSDLVAQADVVITMGCGETCPVFPGKTYQDWKSTTPQNKTSQPSETSSPTSTHVSADYSPTSQSTPHLPAANTHYLNRGRGHPNSEVRGHSNLTYSSG